MAVAGDLSFRLRIPDFWDLQVANERCVAARYSGGRIFLPKAKLLTGACAIQGFEL